MPALRAMIEALIESEQVCINVCNDAHESEARDVLRGLPMERISFHSIPTNEPWCRDHGPVFLTRALATPVSGGQPLQVQPPERSNDTRGRGWAIQPVQGTGCPSGAERIDPKLAIVDWDYNAWGNKYPPFDLDEVVPTHLAQILNVPIFYPRMILEGGAIDVNGAGALLTTESCLLNPNRNPNLRREEIEQRLRDFLGVREILWLGAGIAGDDTDGHIDDLARFVSERTIVAVLEEDPHDENCKPLQENLGRLRRMKIGGRKIDVVTLPMPKKIVREGLRLPASYANFYIANTYVLVPTFADSADEAALSILRECFPHRRVIGIDCRELIWGLGTFHCLTQQQPAV